MVTQHRVWLLCALFAGVTILVAVPGLSEEDSGPGYQCGVTQPMDAIQVVQVNPAVPQVWLEDDEVHSGTARYAFVASPSPVAVEIWNYRFPSWGSYKCLGSICYDETSPGDIGALVCEGSAAQARYIGITYVPNAEGRSDVVVARV